jgi:hypothetical protein
VLADGLLGACPELAVVRPREGSPCKSGIGQMIYREEAPGTPGASFIWAATWGNSRKIIPRIFREASIRLLPVAYGCTSEILPAGWFPQLTGQIT